MTALRAPRRLLLVGGGGREHALAWRLAHEQDTTAVFAVPGSAAIAQEPGVSVEAGVSAVDPEAVVAAARRFRPDLAVIGPEAPLAAGVADALRAAGFAVFGPDAAAARVESSKAFCHDLADEAGIPMARAGAFATYGEALVFAAAVATARGATDPASAGSTGGASRVGGGATGAAGRAAGVVIKADGLAAGKGVFVCDTVDEAEAALFAVFADGDDPDGRPRVVVEERLHGPEASVIALCDGFDAVALPAARDHKRLLDGDEGPNTGGMGAYAPLPDLPDEAVAEIIERFHRPALAALAARGTPFQGALYAGLMLTPDRGPVLLEFNARLGDPETQAILPLLATPLGPLLLAAAEGRLGDAAHTLGIGSLGARNRRGGRGRGPGHARLPGRAQPRRRDRRPRRGAGGGRPRLPRGDAARHGRRLGDRWRPRARGGRPGPQPGGRPRGGRRGGGGGHVPGRPAPNRHRGGPRGGGPMIRRYTRPEMGAVWTEEARFAAMLRVELAVAKAQVSRGLVPADAYAGISARARVDVDRISEIERTTDHDVIAFVSQVAETVGPEGRYLHLGLTSSDVVDTALALQLRAAGDLLLRDADALLSALVARARAESGTVMMGRTHSVHAEPTTLGLKLAGWAFEVDRDRRRLAIAFDDAATGKVSGPVGTYSHLAPDLEAEVLADLGLHADPVSTQIVQRDRHAALVAAIAVTGGSLERFATEVRNLQHTEIGEVMEPFRVGQKGSSAMPHKRNPILCERIAGLARLLRGYAGAALENQPLWHERDISHSSAERVLLPDSSILLDYMLTKMAGLVEGLVVRPERMRENIERGLGLHASSRVLLALVEQGGLAREEAYAVVQRNALRAADARRPLQAFLATDPVVARSLALEQLDACFDDAAFLAHVPEVMRRLDDIDPALQAGA